MKKVSVQQVLAARDELIDFAFQAILNVRAAHHHFETDLKVKEIYGFWAKLLIAKKDGNYRLRMHALGYSIIFYEIHESVLGLPYTAEGVREEATATVDAWLSKIILVSLRKQPELQVENSEESIRNVADVIKDIYPHTLITVTHNGFNYHSMTPTGELLSSVAHTQGPQRKGPGGRLAAARLETCTLHATAEMHDDPLLDSYSGIGRNLENLICTDLTDLIMLGHVNYDLVFEFEDH
ncbi:hypothetical protein PQC06_gp195 [Aeromonas phage LAh10]|uniref:Uncharacterized protein n=1 Tax=Aeromonas phage LAh10 TaxID=2591025 RepID=A0A514A1G5_9CAUD|nr:hypothetical protein PQC06_gp195 [Aeromonas phage LAh10]QDH47121.1 hypothetical protein LAh10_194 [Aeromonas phage LAh10]